MKALMMISALFTMTITLTFTSKANAMFRPEGGFIPTVCGQQLAQRSKGLEANVEQVCIGELAGVAEARVPAVSFRLSNENQVVYRVTSRTNQLVAFISGETKASFFLESLDGLDKRMMKVVLDANGTVKSAQGSLGSMYYLVEEFAPMFVIQGHDL